MPPGGPGGALGALGALGPPYSPYFPSMGSPIPVLSAVGGSAKKCHAWLRCKSCKASGILLRLMCPDSEKI